MLGFKRKAEQSPASMAANGVLVRELEQLREANAGLTGRLIRATEERKLLEERMAVLEANTERLDRVRICSLPLDPVRLTARLRLIEPSLRAEWEGIRLTVYGDVALSEPKLNAVAAMLAQKADFT